MQTYSNHNLVPVGVGRPTYPSLRACLHLGFGVTQVVNGCLFLAVGIPAIVIGAPYSFIGTGIWGAIFIIITGSIAIHAAKTKLVRYVNATLALSTISILMAAAIFITSMIGLFETDYNQDNNDALILNILLLTLACLELLVAFLQATCLCRPVCLQEDSPIAQNASSPQRACTCNDTSHQPSTLSLQPSGLAGQVQPTNQQQLYMYSEGQLVPVLALPSGTQLVTLPQDNLPHYRKDSRPPDYQQATFDQPNPGTHQETDTATTMPYQF